jgi:hypothetical protein
LPTDEEVERRARADLEVKSEKVKAALTLLHRTGACAVVAAPKASIEDFKEGLEARVGRNKDNQSRVLWLPAKGSIQSPDSDSGFGEEKAALQAISALRRASGFVVLGFEGVDFSTAVTAGTNGITNRVSSINSRQNELDKRELARKRRMGEFAQFYKPKYRRDFGVLFIGRGGPNDLTRANVEDNLFNFIPSVPRLALLERNNELDAEFPVIKEPGQDQGLDTGQLNLPI